VSAARHGRDTAPYTGSPVPVAQSSSEVLELDSRCMGQCLFPEESDDTVGRVTERNPTGATLSSGSVLERVWKRIEGEPAKSGKTAIKMEMMVMLLKGKV